MKHLINKAPLILLLALSISCKDGGGGSSSSSKPDFKKTFDSFKKTKTFNKTIVIKKSGTYDFKNVLHKWTGSGKCIQRENQTQCLRIEADNVTVKNLAIKGNCGDVIHISNSSRGQGNYGNGPKNVTIDNLTAHACEDLLTTGKGVKNFTLKNSTLFGNPNSSQRDKIVQLNFGDNIKIQNNKFVDSIRCLRIKPRVKVSATGNSFFNCKQPILASATDADVQNMRNGKPSIKESGNKFYGGGKNGVQKKDYN